ncbi:transmembrane domain-containing protein [Cryptosporidium canis]|uniref:Transmembrane domain-containing protein n=1 Tax=Cryptosporidium canis TaxID=195482 RepID=A0A9D5DG19_9CRYT|nr:transmembrane domain-containing protein [Cryptosporidium canis]
MNAEEAQREFLEFDWSKSTLWQQYYNNLYPTPSASQLLTFKRKWFKKNVNQNLEIQAKDQRENHCQENKFSSCNYQQKNEPRYMLSGHKQWMVLALSVSLLLSSIIPVLNFLPFIRGSDITGVLIKLCSLLYIFGLGTYLYDISNKPIKLLSIEFWQRILSEESFHSLISVLAYFGLINSFPMIFFIPAVTSLFIVSKYQPIIQNQHIIQFFNLANQNKNSLYQRRAFFEVVALGFYIFFATITRKISILYISLYWSLTRVKYPIDPYVQYTFRTVHSKINSFMLSYYNYIPSFIPKLYKWVSLSEKQFNTI